MNHDRPLTPAEEKRATLTTRCRMFTRVAGSKSGFRNARRPSHVFVAPEFRLGWEPETRIAVTIGIRPGSLRDQRLTDRSCAHTRHFA